MRCIAVLMLFTLFGCATTVYEPSHDDVVLKVMSTNYKHSGGHSSGILGFLNKALDGRYSTIDVFYTDSGCSSFRRYGEGYIGRYVIDNSGNFEQLISIPRQKKIFVVTEDHWSGTGHYCTQGVMFHSSEESYVYDLVSIQKSLFNSKKSCPLHKFGLSDSEKEMHHYNRLPVKGYVFSATVDKKACNELMRSYPSL